MILVTGAAGYIGSHFVRKHLSVSEEKILCIDNLSSGHKESLPDDPRIRFEKIDIGDLESMKALLASHSIQAAVHFASSINVGESEKDPFKYFNNNLLNTVRLLEALNSSGVNRLVFSSSCAVYGTPRKLPLTEDHPFKPFNIYGQSKLMVENLLASLNRTLGFSYIALRYFNAAGADESMEIGESHDPETHLIPNVLKVVNGKLPYLEIFGDDYDTPDGTCIRDYVHVNDLADAHISALALLERNENFASGINLGTGCGASVMEVLELCSQISGKSVNHKKLPRREGDVPVLIADFKVAKKTLDWSPKYSMRQIIESAWKWEQNRRF